MSRSANPTDAPERQELKSARETEAPADWSMNVREETAKPGLQFEEKESGSRKVRGEIGETPEMIPERRSPERADKTGKQRFGQEELR